MWQRRWILRASKASAPSGDEARAIPLFSPRQLSVLEGLRQGKANKTIAHELTMRESTVKVHIRNIMRKLNATNRTQVAFLTNAMFEKEKK